MKRHDTYDQYPGHYAAHLASDLGQLASIIVALLDTQDEIIVDVIANSDLVKAIEDADSPVLADSSPHTWLALLMREPRYADVLGQISYADYRKAALETPTRWNIWWATETIFRIAQAEKIHARDVLDVISFEELSERYFTRYHTFPFYAIHEVYENKKIEGQANAKN